MGLVRLLSLYSIIFIAYSCSNNTASVDASTYGLKWKVIYTSANGKVQDSISYISDSNIYHGIYIVLWEIEHVNGESSRIEKSKEIMEYYLGKQDGKDLFFDSSGNLVFIRDYLAEDLVGYKFDFYPNGRVASLDTVTEDHASQPWLMDSLGNIIKRGKPLDTNVLFINIKDKENTKYYKLKHDILDKKYRYWEKY